MREQREQREQREGQSRERERVLCVCIKRCILRVCIKRQTRALCARTQPAAGSLGCVRACALACVRAATKAGALGSSRRPQQSNRRRNSRLRPNPAPSIPARSGRAPDAAGGGAGGFDDHPEAARLGSGGTNSAAAGAVATWSGGTRASARAQARTLRTRPRYGVGTVSAGPGQAVGVFQVPGRSCRTANLGSAKRGRSPAMPAEEVGWVASVQPARQLLYGGGGGGSRV